MPVPTDPFSTITTLVVLWGTLAVMWLLDRRKARR